MFQNIIYIILQYTSSSESPLNLKLAQAIINFYQINKDSEIETRDRLVIKTLIPYQKIISI
jgi:hypothetical protein